jgi:hypothetical protein
MPLVIGLLIVMAAIYQLFFRYESWESDEKPGVMYEHDNFTGETHMIKPNAKVSVFARLLGDGGKNKSADWSERAISSIEKERNESETPRDIKSVPHQQPIDLQDETQVEQVARPVPIPREVVVASSAPPVPGGNTAAYESNTADNARPFAVRQVDLNEDGSIEEIIQNAVQPDGLLDISIVKNGREIFYGRGKQIALLPTRNQGWADIALKMGAKTLQVFRYNAKDAAYRELDDKS